MTTIVEFRQEDASRGRRGRGLEERQSVGGRSWRALSSTPSTSSMRRRRASAARRCPIPYPKHLEDAALPQPQAIAAAAREAWVVVAEFRMPSLGADMEAGTLVEWLKHPGDAVKRGDIIAVVDTHKGAIEIEVFEDGVIETVQVQPGAQGAGRHGAGDDSGDRARTTGRPGSRRIGRNAAGGCHPAAAGSRRPGRPGAGASRRWRGSVPPSSASISTRLKAPEPRARSRARTSSGPRRRRKAPGPPTTVSAADRSRDMRTRDRRGHDAIEARNPALLPQHRRST